MLPTSPRSKPTKGLAYRGVQFLRSFAMFVPCGQAGYLRCLLYFLRAMPVVLSPGSSLLSVCCASQTAVGHVCVSACMCACVSRVHIVHDAGGFPTSLAATSSTTVVAVAGHPAMVLLVVHLLQEISLLLLLMPPCDHPSSPATLLAPPAHQLLPLLLPVLIYHCRCGCCCCRQTTLRLCHTDTH